MTAKNFLHSIDRRTFLRILSVTGISGLIYPRSVISSLVPSGTSRVVIVEHENATSGSAINADIARVMVDSGIKNLTGVNDVGEAWKMLLSGITPDKTVAIKVNCINSALPTHPEVAHAVAAGLAQMNFSEGNFPENNIIIFDRTNWELESAGYTRNTSNIGVRCFATETSGFYYSSQDFNIAGRSQRLSEIIHTHADYLINIAVLKNHGTAGVTLCMKNHYGTCDDPGSLHSNNCDPYIPALNATEPIRTKQMVNIIDALFGIRSGGPGGSPQFVTNKILFSQDVVAIDYQGRKLLEENGCATIGRAHHIDTAASDYNLGTNNPAEMEIINISNPTTDVQPEERNPNRAENFRLEQNYPNPFNSQTTIRFYLKNNAMAKIRIFDYTGRHVRTLLDQEISSGWHQLIWDGRSDAGTLVASGFYVCQLQVGDFKKAVIMQFVK